MVLSDRQKENRKALLVQSAAEDSQPRIYFNRWETIREGNPQMMLDRGESVSLPPLLIMQGERMANGILVVAIDLRLARNRPTRPALQHACLVRSAQSRCNRNYVRGANLGNGSPTIEKQRLNAALRHLRYSLQWLRVSPDYSRVTDQRRADFVPQKVFHPKTGS